MVAGSASPVGPLPVFVYVLWYVPPGTSRLTQQLSLDAPQFVSPAPPGAQLVPLVVWQYPFTMVLDPGHAAHEPAPIHIGVPPEHAVAFCQVPVELHVCGCVLDPHCVCPGAHTPWQEPLTHVWFTHDEPLFCQTPVLLHVCGCWPTHWTDAGAHAPVHEPLTQAWLTQTVAFCHAPLVSHVCGCVLDVHWVAPGEHSTQLPFKQAGVVPEHADPLLTQTPLTQICGWVGAVALH